eukprot:CAMPEP_0198558618 /NCGR_PEP_ID=MMETSP1462-20131121/90817_1 /TAXON_ID=1333877 /ORGANISM="Brandtodinium nutriculum, Strain RCC3387" /LENGTH=202 /DNA_ID=CAMNT_0044289447 /DNA_START=86 /DNA_END=691 /DNA_ORIENTATION=+
MMRPYEYDRFQLLRLFGALDLQRGIRPKEGPGSEGFAALPISELSAEGSASAAARRRDRADSGRRPRGGRGRGGRPDDDQEDEEEAHGGPRANSLSGSRNERASHPGDDVRPSSGPPNGMNLGHGDVGGSADGADFFSNEGEDFFFEGEDDDEEAPGEDGGLGCRSFLERVLKKKLDHGSEEEEGPASELPFLPPSSLSVPS